MKPWKRIEPTKITKVGWRTIVSKSFIMQNGETVIFDTICPDGQEFAVIIAITPDKKVVIARQFRTGPEKIMDDLPGGFVDSSEAHEAAMRRELKEETGYEAGKVMYLGNSHKDAFINAVWHYYIGFDCVKTSGQDLEAEEEIEVVEISINELIDNAKNDRMTDPAAVLMGYDMLQELAESSSNGKSN